MISGAHCFQVLDARNRDRLHRQSFELLERTGVVFDSEPILALCRNKGLSVSGKTVYFTEKDLDAALLTCPKGFVMHGRSPEASVVIGRNQRVPIIAPGNGTLFIHDLENGRRQATLDDFETITKLCESSRNVHLVGSIPVDPTDVPETDKPARLVHSLLKYSQKPLIGIAATEDEVATTFAILEMAFGCKGFLEEHVAIAYGVNPSSPLSFDASTCATLLAYARRKQALFVLPVIMAGLSGPLDLWGTAVLSNAENLAALICAQLIRPGTPVVYSSGSLMVNMHNGYVITGSPQANLINVAGLQMAREHYDLPSRTMAGLTDAKVPDYQAGAETMQNLIVSTLAGANVMNETLGVLDSIMATSFEKWMLDEELLDRMSCLSLGLEQMSAANSLSAIQEVGSGGDFMSHESTLDHCRSIWMPNLSVWSSYLQWAKQPEQDLLKKARGRLSSILETQQSPCLDAAVDTAIAEYLERGLQ